jgi:hypothetical protein
MRARSQSSQGFRYLRLISAITPVVLAVVPGCSDTINNSYTTNVYQTGNAGEAGEGPSQPHPTAGTTSHPDGGSPEAGAGGSGGTSAGEGGAGGEVTSMGGEGGQPDDGHALYPNAPYADIDVPSQELDLFGQFGTKFWFGVSQEQLDIMNNGDQGGGIPGGPFGGDPYTPGGGDASGPFVDHLWVTGNDGHVADYDKVKVKVVGQSSRRLWSPQSIPNLNVDSNEFLKGQLINGYEHLRLNNAQVGNIFREWLSLTIYEKLNYPAPHVSFAKIGSNVWAKGVEIPMVLVERYKRRFCERFKEWGGGCNNMWEMYGQDFGGGFGFPGPKGGPAVNGFYDDPNNCQLDKCEDTTRVRELDQLLANTADGPGFKAATADYIDWPAFHRFQCAEWLMWIGDDVLHNMNNIVLVEGKDGKFRYLPYSTDISVGQEWYQNTALPGQNRIARGCQADESCWQDTIATCEDVIDEFKALDPVKLLEDLNTALDAAGMLRPGDDVRYDTQRKWFEDRLAKVDAELDSYRAGPNPPIQCQYPLVDCGGYCDYPEYCPQQCKPPVGKLAAAAPPPVDIGMGAAGAGPIIDPPIDPGAGGAGGGPICPMITNYPVKL